MTDAERYAKLRALYLLWHDQTGSDYHAEMAGYAAMMAEGCE